MRGSAANLQFSFPRRGDLLCVLGRRALRKWKRMCERRPRTNLPRGGIPRCHANVSNGPNLCGHSIVGSFVRTSLLYIHRFYIWLHNQNRHHYVFVLHVTFLFQICSHSFLLSTKFSVAHVFLFLGRPSLHSPPRFFFPPVNQRTLFLTFPGRVQKKLWRHHPVAWSTVVTDGLIGETVTCFSDGAVNTPLMGSGMGSHVHVKKHVWEKNKKVI